MNCTATIDCSLPKEEADRLRKCLGADSEQATYKQTAEGLRITLISGDMAGLRAGFNSVTKLISVHEHMEKV